MKRIFLLVTIVLGLGGCSQVDLSGLHDLQYTIHSVQPVPSAPRESSLPPSVMLAHYDPAKRRDSPTR